MLEALFHSASSFVTLTYAQDHLPEGATLVPKHTQLWLKRLRKVVGISRLRYFLVGEYGEASGRPHYHAAVFGLPPSSKSLLEESWPLGLVQIGTLTKDSAAYICEYVTKKMTGKEDERLCGRYPEFARMSLKPGIGFGSVGVVSDAVRRVLGFTSGFVGVPHVLRHGSALLPLGRYLRGKIRECLYGDQCDSVKASEINSYRKEVQELFRGEIAKQENACSSLSSIVGKRDHQKVLTMEAKFNIFRQRRTL